MYKREYPRFKRGQRWRKSPGPKYPPNWYKASITLRRAIGHCELCGATDIPLTVHHKGASFADGRVNHPTNKRDYRYPENLQVLCFACHDRIEEELEAAYLHKLAQHRALGVGTGLVVVDADASQRLIY